MIINKTLKGKTNVQNLLTIYKLTKVFNLKTLAEKYFRYIESCFTMLAETPNFLELDYSIVARVFGSNNLHITTELEVFNSANGWLSYNINKRKSHAKNLLLKVRLPLLSDHCLRYILKRSSSLSENEDCVAMLKEVLENKEKFIKKNSSFCYSHRYCSHSNFSLLVFGGLVKASAKTVGNVSKISGRNLQHVTPLSSLPRPRLNSMAVCVKDEVYVFSGEFDWRQVKSVERYSIVTDTWHKVDDMYDGRGWYCICAFMDKIFVLGGTHQYMDSTNTCLQFNTKDCEWKEVAGMNEARRKSACAVFEGRIVVAGGRDDADVRLNSVESYDVHADEWHHMPNMIRFKIHHRLVVVRNKLLVIGPMSCEVFDNESKTFVALRLPGGMETRFQLSQVIAIGRKFFVFQTWKKPMYYFDADRDEYIKTNLKYKISNFSCVKIPWICFN